MEEITWTGYGYSVTLDRQKAIDLFNQMKEYNGSQEEFYFKHVNKMKLKKVEEK